MVKSEANSEDRPMSKKKQESKAVYPRLHD